MSSRLGLMLLVVAWDVGSAAAIPPPIVRHEMRGYLQSKMRIALSVRCVFYEGYETYCEGTWRCRPARYDRQTACPIASGEVSFEVYERIAQHPAPPTWPAPGRVSLTDGTRCTLDATIPYKFFMAEIPGLFGTIACVDAGGDSVLSQTFGARTVRKGPLHYNDN